MAVTSVTGETRTAVHVVTEKIVVTANPVVTSSATRAWPGKVALKRLDITVLKSGEVLALASCNRS
ncbi:hypothetical protein C0Q70_21435 [Pomacea canaliculata]|uniref:Uncharacterized protein n=1 Tax=Pomacea canaliculata TaxID=400727 RepID=A0A2T7NCI4_POMCA|nr:hypothetical protein C0Q70_21435 [Pomacea canaliculata]